MKTIMRSLVCLLLLVGCKENTKKEETILEALHENQEKPAMIGSDKDQHGCKGSAGYTWSQLREDCIRIFEEGETLLPIEVDETDAVYASFVLFSLDESQAELFLPKEKESLILERENEKVYAKDRYRLDKASMILYIDGEPRYQEDR